MPSSRLLSFRLCTDKRFKPALVNVNPDMLRSRIAVQGRHDDPPTMLRRPATRKALRFLLRSIPADNAQESNRSRRAARDLPARNSIAAYHENLHFSLQLLLSQ